MYLLCLWSNQLSFGLTGLISIALSSHTNFLHFLATCISLLSAPPPGLLPPPALRLCHDQDTFRHPAFLMLLTMKEEIVDQIKFQDTVNLLPTCCSVDGTMRGRRGTLPADARTRAGMISFLPLFPCPRGALPFPCVSRKCVVHSPADSSPSPPPCPPLLHLMNILQASWDIPPPPLAPLLSSHPIPRHIALSVPITSGEGSTIEGHLLRPTAEQGEQWRKNGSA